MIKTILHIIVLLLIASTCCYPVDFNGQVTGWLNRIDTGSEVTGLGLRYIPWLQLSKPSGENGIIDAEISVNGYVSSTFDGADPVSDIRPYRLSVRYSGKQYEARLGLQKINFGPAKLMRSLMWFDSVDPRDPLELTDGVYALMCRYFFMNNANLWVWGIYGNENTKGWELVRTDPEKLEAGGRCQYPVPYGEVALTMDTRCLDRTAWTVHPQLSLVAPTLTDGQENRIALDGSWDIGVGLWFESSLSETRIDTTLSYWQNHMTVGIDYTFNPGLMAVLENFSYSAGTASSELSRQMQLSALSLNYPLNIMDSLTFMGYYYWEGEDFFAFGGWQRSYDTWTINCMLFSSPDIGIGSISGNGIQVMVSYNH